MADEIDRAVLDALEAEVIRVYGDGAEVQVRVRPQGKKVAFPVMIGFAEQPEPPRISGGSGGESTYDEAPKAFAERMKHGGIEAEDAARMIREGVRGGQTWTGGPGTADDADLGDFPPSTSHATKGALLPANDDAETDINRVQVTDHDLPPVPLASAFSHKMVLTPGTTDLDAFRGMLERAGIAFRQTAMLAGPDAGGDLTEIMVGGFNAVAYLWFDADGALKRVDGGA